MARDGVESFLWLYRSSNAIAMLVSNDHWRNERIMLEWHEGSMPFWVKGFMAAAVQHLFHGMLQFQGVIGGKRPTHCGRS